jgi:excisionase family DNA binding protein
MYDGFTEDEKYYTTSQAAELFDVSSRTIRNYIRKGTLRARKKETSTGSQWIIPQSSIEEARKKNPHLVERANTKKVSFPDPWEKVSELEKERAHLTAQISRLEERLRLLPAPARVESLEEKLEHAHNLIFRLASKPRPNIFKRAWRFLAGT